MRVRADNNSSAEKNTLNTPNTHKLNNSMTYTYLSLRNTAGLNHRQLVTDDFLNEKRKSNPRVVSMDVL